MSLERLEINPFPNIIQDILQERRSGLLTLVASGSRRLIHWAYGDVVLVESDRPEEMLHSYLLKQSAISEESARELEQIGPRNAALHFTDSTMVLPAARHSLLREWMGAVITPLFSLDAGTAAFDDTDPLAPEQRVFLSTPSLVLEGIRAIQSGLVLRSSLGDLKRRIEPVFDPPFEIETLPLNPEERGVFEELDGPILLQDFLKKAPISSIVASRTVIAMFTFGLCREVIQRASGEGGFDTTEQDMQILSAIAGDQKALEVVALSRQMDRVDHYRFIDVPKAATRTQIVMRAEELQQKYDVSSYPAIVREAVEKIRKRIDDAVTLLQDADRRRIYDELLDTRQAGASPRSIEQQAARRSLASQNYRKAEELFLKGDYHSAIVLLEQAVKFEPNNANAWHLLGMNQRNNPHWRRDAADSFHRALSIDPSRLDTMIALGDLYLDQKMPSRARNFYEDARRTNPESELVKSRLKKATNE